MHHSGNFPACTADLSSDGLNANQPCGGKIVSSFDSKGKNYQNYRIYKSRPRYFIGMNLKQAHPQSAGTQVI
jgi:hypothetical protein